MILFENKTKALISKEKYNKRLRDNFLLALAIIFISLFIGVVGYMFLADLAFVDAVLNASMILGGMGPVDVLHTDASKYFASFYALFSGITLITSVGILFAPMVHRAMHKFHLETDSEEDAKEDNKK